MSASLSRLAPKSLLKLLLTVALGLAGPVLLAQTPTVWTGSDGVWTTAGNWTSGVPDAAAAPTRKAVFDGQGASTVDGGVVSSQLEFTGGNYTVNFATGFKKGQGAAPVTINAGTQTFNGVAFFAETTVRTWTVASGATLNLNNGLSSSNNGRHLFDIAGTAHLGGLVSSDITKQGNGILTIEGDNFTARALTVNGGTLLVNNGFSNQTGTSPTTVNSGGILGGIGTIATGPTTINSGGTLAPGAVGVGILSFGKTLTLAGGSTTAFEINGTTRGTGYDGLNITGATSLGGTLALSFGSTFLNGETFDLFQLTGGVTSATSFDFVTGAGSYTGSFLKTGDLWNLTSGGQLLSFDQSTGSLTIAASASAVPEPATCAMLAGVAALAGASWRRRRARNAGDLPASA